MRNFYKNLQFKKKINNYVCITHNEIKGWKKKLMWTLDELYVQTTPTMI
jgi:hypothetical protein